MKLTKLPSISVVFLLTLQLALAGGGGGKKGGKAEPDVPTDTRTLVQSVDLKNQTVTLVSESNKSVHTYKIDIGTTITVGSSHATFGDIKAGMEALSFQERDAQSLDAISVGTATTAPPTPAAKPAKKKKTAGT